MGLCLAALAAGAFLAWARGGSATEERPPGAMRTTAPGRDPIPARARGLRLSCPGQSRTGRQMSFLLPGGPADLSISAARQRSFAYPFVKHLGVS
ncbi:hypothetical protein GCM10010507_60130 [Streptomyces cinnamoneus]|uniref:Alpha/beta hydrolase n=1 Tax=Streptomyces cinnamoneus TaxID=53446 RepID=A0A918TZU2_STRCJ|nr:hypothetical protein GCM10010507_60130 [Streptomyces cinnamoneus]